MDEEDNILRPVYGGSAAQLPPALDRIENGERILSYKE